MTLTVAIADTRNHLAASYALYQTLQHITPDEVLVFSDQEHGWLGEHRFVKILPIEHISDYSALVLGSRTQLEILADHLRTDHVLIVQWDGYAINGAAWSDEFLKWDYIGGPMATAAGPALMNGGFSLRSRRMVEAAASTLPLWRGEAEDVWQCQHMRHILEQRHGCRFAPPEVAERFAFCDKPRPDTFGFHGRQHLPKHHHPSP